MPSGTQAKKQNLDKFPIRQLFKPSNIRPPVASGEYSFPKGESLRQLNHRQSAGQKSQSMSTKSSIQNGRITLYGNGQERDAVIKEMTAE